MKKLPRYLVKGQRMKDKNSEIIISIAKAYFVSKKQLNLTGFSSGRVDIFNPYYKYVNDVEIAFSHLKEDEKLIINNDYFYNDYFGWWKIVFTQREYLSIKKRAEKNFLRYFYEIH